MRPSITGPPVQQQGASHGTAEELSSTRCDLHKCKDMARQHKEKYWGCMRGFFSADEDRQ